MANTALASLVAEFSTLPICLTKTVYQTQKGNMSIVDTIKKIYSQRGLLGFYSASYPAVISQVVSTTSKYTIFNVSKIYRQTNEKDIFDNSINGMIGGVCGGLITHPIDVIKNYHQRSRPFFKIFGRMFYRSKPMCLKFLYRGVSQSVYKGITLYSLLFPLQEWYKTMGFHSVFASILTTVITTTLLQPFDYLKVKLIAGQTDLLQSVKKYVSSGNSHFKLRDLYKGVGLNFARAVPHFTITMTIIDYLSDENKLNAKK